jgi:RNA polymerase sigma factor (sigma-70 family)
VPGRPFRQRQYADAVEPQPDNASAVSEPPAPVDVTHGDGHVKDGEIEISELIDSIRRVVAGRVRDQQEVDDLVQETLARVLAAQHRIEPGMMAPYAAVTARNLVTSMWQDQDRRRRNLHRVLDRQPEPGPEDELVEREERDGITEALRRLSSRERHTLVAHEVAGRDTRSLGHELGTSPGAVAAQLSRARARLRVEYLLTMDHIEPPTDRCRAVLLALSAGDRRRQRELDAGRHLLECDLCARLSEPLTERRRDSLDETRIPIRRDADVVLARQRGREIAADIGFSATDLTLIATAISEITRNIVRFADRGEITITEVEDGRRGIHVVARDAGPGIADVEAAVADGYSTYGGLGLGLPGVRRLMDEFGIVSEPGRGTTVTMTKWHRER